MKASCFTKRPWASRKCSGWKRRGFSQIVSSFSTEDRLVMRVVPWQETHGVNMDCGRTASTLLHGHMYNLFLHT